MPAVAVSSARGEPVTLVPIASSGLAFEPDGDVIRLLARVEAQVAIADAIVHRIAANGLLGPIERRRR